MTAIRIPVGTPTKIIDNSAPGSTTSNTYQFEFDGPISALYVAFELVSGSATLSTFSLHQNLIEGGRWAGSADPGAVSVGVDTSSSGPGSADWYAEWSSNLVYGGHGVFYLTLNLTGAVTPVANLAVLGV